MAAKPINVLLVTDHVMVREGLAALIAKDREMRVVGQCGEGLQVVDLVRELKSDVVVTDIDLPGISGLEVCRELTHKIKGVAVLMLSMYDDENFVVSAMKNGASGFILKDAAADHLIEGIRAVAAGNRYISPGVSKEVLNHISRDDGAPHDMLTPREQQVFKMVAEGKTNRKIAEELDLALKTIDTHRTRLMRKLGILGIDASRKQSKGNRKLPPAGEAVGAKPKGNGGILGGFADCGESKPQESGNYPMEKPKQFSMEDREAREKGPPRIPPKKKRRRRGPDTKSSR